jgi:hypothetical protein
MKPSPLIEAIIFIFEPKSRIRPFQALPDTLEPKKRTTAAGPESPQHRFPTGAQKNAWLFHQAFFNIQISG